MLVSYAPQAYLSILYLRLPESFTIVLRGKFVKHHNLALDLKFQEFIVYRPQSSGCIKGELLTTIGFLKEAPQVTVHGFNIYHKNRLILVNLVDVRFGSVVGVYLHYMLLVTVDRSARYGIFMSNSEICLFMEYKNVATPEHQKMMRSGRSMEPSSKKRRSFHGIDPFWPIVNYGNNSRSRGVVGVLEANFVEPTHDKQDFERTSLFQKLEVRLKEMTWEYWDYHCGLIGYQVTKKLRPTEPPPDSPLGVSTGSDTLNHGMPNVAKTNHALNQNYPYLVSAKAASAAGSSSKRKEHSDLDKLEGIKRQAGTGANAFLSGHGFETEVVSDIKNKLEDQDVVNLIQENKNFRAKCFDYKKRTEDLDLKVTRLRSELGQVRTEYEQLMAELTS
ncbi:hypothetical protein NC651_033913 [Populus alba x Populus x berolinensis]|nr:hypothetical protein NC651_033913 [Populus alba x Populus x berolinensis]